MKKLSACLSMAILSVCVTANADNLNPINEVFAQVGASVPMLGGDSGTQTLGLVGYRYTPSWYYLEADAGGWAGSRHTGIAAAQIGLDYQNFSIGTGPAVITDTSSSLGTHQQFLSSIRWTCSAHPLYIAYNHVSNGESIFNNHGDEPNHGENFFSIGYIHNF